MNQRIAELMIEAGKTIPGDKHIDADFCDKFAKLIVLECVSISEQYDKGLSENDAECFTCRKVAYTISDRIQKHFGVEE